MIEVSDLPVLELVTATGALGAAAFGIVDVCKNNNFFWIGSAGWKEIKKGMGTILYEALTNAYGVHVDSLIQRQFMNSDEEMLKHTLRQGIRVGMRIENAEELSAEFGLDKVELMAVAAKLANGEALEDKDKNILTRFEFAADARIDAAVAKSRQVYQGWMQFLAMLFSLIFAVGAGQYMRQNDLVDGPVIMTSIFIGIVAVPLAPISKDVATAINSAAQVLRRRN